MLFRKLAYAAYESKVKTSFLIISSKNALLSSLYLNNYKRISHILVKLEHAFKK